MERIRPKILLKSEPVGERRAAFPPLWLSNPVYFAVTGVLSIAIFIVILSVWGDEHYDNGAGLAALIAASIVFIFAVSIRQVLIRRAKYRLLLKQEGMVFTKTTHSKRRTGKFTLEAHAASLQAVQIKSDAADSPNAAAEEHLSAYRACGEYLEQIESELPHVHAGSPRLAAFRSGQERIKALQKHHLLEFTADESRELLREAQVRATTNEKIEAAQRAIEVIEAALQLYPGEQQLLASEVAVREFMVSVRVAHWVELAERAAFKGHWQQAIDHFHDALFYLSRETVNSAEREATAAQIEKEIARLQEKQMQENKRGGDLVLPGSDL